MHVGEVIVGHIGSASRHEYTVIGDVVGCTVKLEELTRTLKYPVVCTDAVAKAVENSGGLVDCGKHTIKGDAFQIYGWNPPLLAAD